jgi:hypothetical protein
MFSVPPFSLDLKALVNFAHFLFSPGFSAQIIVNLLLFSIDMDALRAKSTDENTVFIFFPT